MSDDGPGLTLGADGLRILSSGYRITVLRSAILGVARGDDLARMIHLSMGEGRTLMAESMDLSKLPAADLDALEAWLLDPSPGALVSTASLQPTPTTDPATAIGVGSIVSHQGELAYYQVTRPGHTVDGVRMWRVTNGRQLPEHDLRPVTPIRIGDIVQTTFHEDGSWWGVSGFVPNLGGLDPVGLILSQSDTGRSMTCTDAHITRIKRLVDGLPVTIR